jgi:hypothetical protein
MKANNVNAKRIENAVLAVKKFEGSPLACANRVATVAKDKEFGADVIDLFNATFESVRSLNGNADKVKQVVKILKGYSPADWHEMSVYTVVDGAKRAVDVHKVEGKYYFTVRTEWTPRNIIEAIGQKYNKEEIPQEQIITLEQLKDIKDAAKADKKAAKEAKEGKGLTSLDAALDFIAGCSADDFIKVMKAVQARNAKSN